MYVLNISHVCSLTSSRTALGFAGSPAAREERAGPRRHRSPRVGGWRCSPGSGEAAPAPFCRGKPGITRSHAGCKQAHPAL